MWETKNINHEGKFKQVDFIIILKSSSKDMVKKVRSMEEIFIVHTSDKCVYDSAKDSGIGRVLGLHLRQEHSGNRETGRTDLAMGVWFYGPGSTRSVGHSSCI